MPLPVTPPVVPMLARLAPELPADGCGLYDDQGALQHVGVATSFTEARRRELLEELAPLPCACVGIRGSTASSSAAAESAA